jgi:hypothetical protein
VAIPAIIDHNFDSDHFALAASSDPNVLHLKAAMAADDSQQFVTAMQEEVQAHVRDNNWIIIHKSTVPKDHKILPSVWAFRRKRDIATRNGFIQSQTDPCVFWKGMVILVIYTDDTIVTGPCNEDVQTAVRDIGKKFNITSKPTVDDFLGVKITRDDKAGTLTMTQPHLIDSILEDLHLDDKANGKKLPAQPTKLLQKFTNSEDHDNSFHYRSVIGKLN